MLRAKIRHGSVTFASTKIMIVVCKNHNGHNDRCDRCGYRVVIMRVEYRDLTSWCMMNVVFSFWCRLPMWVDTTPANRPLRRKSVVTLTCAVAMGLRVLVQPMRIALTQFNTNLQSIRQVTWCRILCTSPRRRAELQRPQTSSLGAYTTPNLTSPVVVFWGTSQLHKQS